MKRHNGSLIPATAVLLVICVPLLTCRTLAGPDAPMVSNHVAYFEGNQSNGVVWLNALTAPSVVVRNLSSDITPATGAVGVDFRDYAGRNIFITSGEVQSNVVIRTVGVNAMGVHAESQGQPAPAVDDPFLEVPVPGSPAAAGGVVDVESDSLITTDGVGAHGIFAESRTTGYGPDVINALNAFSDAGFAFAVSDVAGTISNVGQVVAGSLIDTNGNPVAGAGGFFLINADGTYAFNPGTNFLDLALGEERQTAVAYNVLGQNPSGITDNMTALLVVTVALTTNGFEITPEAYFDEYGISGKPTATNGVQTVFPDLKRYVEGLKADAGAGGAGNSVSIRNKDAIETRGAYSHGIYAQSKGGKGGRGRGGSISHSADPGHPGKPGGQVTIEGNGSIITRAVGSIGILAHSLAGDGGHGGNGGTWRYGQRGGSGGDGGEVLIEGDGTIHTFGDFSSGIIALSEGGNGGTGGSGDFVTGGGRGGYGGQGGSVVVNGSWNITTESNKAHGIWAKSMGGNAGTGGSGGWLAGSPGGGGQATDGGSVTVSSSGGIETFGADSYAIYAQSVGGFGGKGGSAGGIFYAAGGDGNSAGSGGAVSVLNQETGLLTTHGIRAHALFAQSIGGGGGSGGGAGALVGVGGEGGAGGSGGSVAVLNHGTIQTFGGNARGIYAQSIGGGGGDGGDSGGLVAIGGKGSGTSDGGSVTVTNTGTITTAGIRSSAIFAESIGGGGGDGGSSAGWFSIGGAGGGGGNASNVTVSSSGPLTTLGSDSSAVFAQSVGGGGGNGGGAISGGLFGSLAIGGSGATGGDAGELVKVGSDAAIITAGERSHGIFAQSVGGGGGNGGYAVSAAVGSFISMSVAMGGDGAGGGDGRNVEIANEGDITTYGKDAHGIFAQSVGGGGGSGGFSVAFSASGGGISGSLSMGGTGAGGGDGGKVVLGSNDGENQENFLAGNITTFSDHAYGMLAQSVGGGGGDGGFSVAGSIGGPSVAVGIGGSGGGGGLGGEVDVYSKSAITTHGKDAHGLVAQSVGGGGGSGGFSIAGAVSGIAGAVSLGGSGGTGNAGGSVTVDNRGDISTGIDGRDVAGVDMLEGLGSTILDQLLANGYLTVSNLSTATVPELMAIEGIDATTANTILFKARVFMEKGDHAYGILAQSVGGSGGDGGFSVGAAIGMGAAAFSMGGSGGNGGIGGAVDVYTEGAITTRGNDAHGIVAQSVGGGGGSGGFSVSGALTAGEPSGGAAASLGGSGGIGNIGGTVMLDSFGTINTYGNHAYGILAQSVGGGGGDGGFSVGAATGQGAAAFSMGGSGGSGGSGGAVDVHSGSLVSTMGTDAHGIVAQSVGGGGGSGGFSVAGSASSQGGAAASLGGSGGAGNAGGTVSLDSLGDISTAGEHAYGILAQSVGGGGGDGGFSVGAAVSKYAAAFSMGGSGGIGGTGGHVDVYSQSQITTMGGDSHGMIAQSLGGGGGSGGFSVAGSLSTKGGGAASIGGSGGSGNAASSVTVTNLGEVHTFGDRAYGILAQSVGGGGGDGGFSVAGTVSKDGPAAAFSMGGSGGSGGNSGEVQLFTDNSIYTAGSNSHAVVAQSVAGGGGSGGFSVAGTISASSNYPAVSVSIGGSGGVGGNASTVVLDSAGDLISTTGDNAYGLLAQSLGGGGGNGGFSVAGGISRSKTVSVSVGGSGGAAGSGGTVILDNASQITTSSTNAHGIFAQSVGGGGGSGGFSVAGSVGVGSSNNMQVAVSVGGSGGAGGASGAVAVRTSGDIATQGTDARGIYAQSVGGGGGNGGFSVAGSFGRSGAKNLSVSVGGSGGGGGQGSGVFVDSTGVIDTLGDGAHGIEAQSIGGGGGNGGMALAIDFGLSDTNNRNVNIAVAIGGGGGNGNMAGNVTVLNQTNITTRGNSAHGILAQSIGGGGGNGGFALAGTVSLEKKNSKQPINVDTAVGGGGGNGSDGGDVVVNNSGKIETFGDGSSGIFVHTIGGGGGIGGGARALALDVNPRDWIPKLKKDGVNEYLTDLLSTWNIAVGGSGGGASDGGSGAVTNTGDIITHGAESHGIFAQSIGGGGGVGGDAAHGIPEVPAWLEPLLELTPLKGLEDMQIVVGGSGGSSGNGKEMAISNEGTITTHGDGSCAIFVQSVGAGGGVGGSGALGLIGNVGIGGAAGSAGNGGAVAVTHSGQIDTYGDAASGIFAQSIGGGGGLAGNVDRGIGSFGIGFAYGRGGGNAGNGGEVAVQTVGDIITRGSGSFGIFAQSVGGGGGLAGTVGYGPGFAGSVGGAGNAGAVSIEHRGNIMTAGTNAYGIFAQSAAGSGSGDNVGVALYGDVHALGEDSAGIFVQSRGDLGQGNITVDIFGGDIMGGSGSGAGVQFADGSNNTLNNFGSIGTVDGVYGNAILGTPGSEAVHNDGVVSGSVDLGGGNNLFNNYSAAIFYPGPTINLGTGNRLVNAGTLSPGDVDHCMTTRLTGDFLQTDSGLLLVDVSPVSGSDELLVDGMATLDGAITVVKGSGGLYADGTVFDVLVASNRLFHVFNTTNLPDPKPFVEFDFKQQPDRIKIETDVRSFESFGGNRLQRSIGRQLDRLAPSATGDLLEILTAFQEVDKSGLEQAYASLGPSSYDAATRAALSAARQSAGNIRGRTAGLASRQGSKNKPIGASGPSIPFATIEPATTRNPNGLWFSGIAQKGEQDGEDGFSDFNYRTGGLELGIERMFETKVIGGLSIDYASTRVDVDSPDGNHDIDAIGGSLYAAHYSEGLYVDAILRYAHQKYDSSRRVLVGGINRTAESSHSGDLMSASTTMRYDLSKEAWKIGPLAALHYVRLKEGGIKEKGAGAANLTVSGRTTHSLVSELGLRVAKTYETKYGSLIPAVKLVWLYDFDVDERSITSAYEGAPNMSFTVDGQDVDQHGVQFSAGVHLLGQAGLSLGLEYDTEFFDHYEAHGIWGVVHYAF